MPGCRGCSGTLGKISYERGFTMIATHNIKVDGRWIAAGEHYGQESMEEIYAAALANNAPAAEPEAEPAEELKAETKPKTTRRKASK